MTIPFLLALAGALSGAPQVQPPPHPRHSLIEALGSPDFDTFLRKSGMSPAGIAVLHRLPATDPPRLNEAICAVIAASSARPLDLDRLDEALAQRDTLAARQATREHVTLITALRLLDADDAAILLSLVNTGGHAGPPPGLPPSAWSDGPPPGPPPEGNCPD